MAEVRVSYNLDQTRAELVAPGGPVWTDLHQRGNRVLVRARQLVPVDTGRLRGSLTLEMRYEGDLPVAVVGSNLPYAIYVEKGTGIYAGRGPIRPRAGRFLRWPFRNLSGVGRVQYKGGATARYIFARQVKGQPGQHYLEKALDAAK